MDLVILGSQGKLGQAICLLSKEQSINVIALRRENVASYENFAAFAEQHITKDCIVLDVSLPDGTNALCSHLLSAVNQNKKSLNFIRGLVIGTTGHDHMTLDSFSEMSAHLPICIVPNFSKGVFLFEEILNAKTTSGLPVWELATKLGFDLGMTETHHSAKKDAPSGTALLLAQAAHLEKNRIASLRVGKVVGEHTLIASTDYEQLSITHTAHSRDLFAQGALELCQKIFNKKPKAGFLFPKNFL